MESEGSYRDSLRNAVELIPACPGHAERRLLLDEAIRSLLFLAQCAERDGYLEKASSYRRLVRAVAGLSPLAVDVRCAAALYAALGSADLPGGDRATDRLLTAAGL
jgi:hypothetical protein